MIRVTTTIEADPDVELVARVICSYNRTGVGNPDDGSWPPPTKSAEMKYLNMGAVVIRALRRTRK